MRTGFYIAAACFIVLGLIAFGVAATCLAERHPSPPALLGGFCAPHPGGGYEEPILM